MLLILVQLPKLLRNGYNSYMKDEVLNLTKQLFDKVSNLKLNEAAGIFGSTNKQNILDKLRSSVVDLSKSIEQDESYDLIMKKYEVLAGFVDTATVSGIISEEEATDYYKLVDDIWIALEKINK